MIPFAWATTQSFWIQSLFVRDSQRMTRIVPVLCRPLQNLSSQNVHILDDRTGPLNRPRRAGRAEIRRTSPFLIVRLLQPNIYDAECHQLYGCA